MKCRTELISARHTTQIYYPFDERVVLVEGLFQHGDKHIDEGGAGDVAARVNGEVVGAERLERLGARLEHLGV